MKIVHTYPPNFEEIDAKFHIKDRKTIVFTYGDTLYAPGCAASDISHDLLVHEETHVGQQGDKPELWWKKYLVDEQFRFQQELQAYRNQYQFYKQTHTRNQAYFLAHKLAMDLSSSMYGTVTSYDDAIRLIRK